MKILFILLFFAININCFSQPNARRKTVRSTIRFPQSFIGNWKGTMMWYPNNGKKGMEVPVQLNIQPLKDSANQFTWQIIYGAKQEDNRPYILKQIDTIKNHWVVDELNGIVLDGYWLGNRYTGAFAVQGNVILDSYWLEKDELHFEFFSYPQKPMKTSGNNTEDSPIVDVYRINSYQKGVMKRVK